MTRVKRSCRLAVAAVAVVSTLVFGSGQALAAHGVASGSVSRGLAPWTSRVLTPAPGALVLGRSVRVVVRTGPAVSSFQVSVGSRVVTGAFRPAGRHLRVATLRFGGRSGLRFGHSTLQVETGDRRGRRGFSQSSFVVARLVGGLLKSASARWLCGAGTRVRLGLARAGLRLKVWVDGRATGLRAGGSSRSFSLDADNGLRAGVNVISVRALDAAAGAYALRRARLVLPPDSPVAGAGPSKRTRVGHAVRLDAGASAPASPKLGLRYRWVIVQKPRGSRARLLDASSPRPRLRPDRPGHYVLRVTVTDAGHRVPAPRAGLGRAGGSCASRGSSSDTTTVTAAVDAPPIGAPVDTIDSQNGKLGVDVTVAGAGFYPVTDSSKALQLVVLDRSTLTLATNVAANQSFSNDPAGAAALLSTVKALPSADLVIVTKPNPTLTNAPAASASSAASTINQALGLIGVSSLPIGVLTGASACDHQGPCSAFSAIGVPGMSAGQGKVNPGLSSLPGSGVPGGDLHGYFTPALNAANGFLFLNRERVTFDTGDPGANPAVMSVSDEAGKNTTYTSAPLTGPGFFVVVLDAGSLVVRDHGTFTTGTAVSPTVGNLSAMSQLLSKWDTDPSALVMIRSIGAVGSTPNPQWDAVADAIHQLGGSKFYFDALDGRSSAHYAQVAPGGDPAGYPSPWTQVASAQRSNSGRLTGLLARDPSSQFYPDESTDPGTPLAGTLPGLISLPATTWPARDPGGEQNAMRLIANQLRIRYPIQANYAGDVNDSWPSLKSSLDEANFYSQLTSRTDFNTYPFTLDDFKTVRAQLDLEWTYVPAVMTMISNLKSPYTGPSGNGSAIGDVAAQINTTLETSTQNVSVNPLDIVEDLFWAASAIPGVGELANVASAGIALAQLTNVNSQGITPTDVTGTAQELAEKLQGTYASAITGLDKERDMLLSDWGKLQTAGLNAMDSPNINGEPNKTADWKWDTAVEGQADFQVQLAAQRVAYTTLFPARFELYRAQNGTSGYNHADITTYSCTLLQDIITANGGGWVSNTWAPFHGSPAYGAIGLATSGGGASSEVWPYAVPDKSLFTTLNRIGQYPGEGVLKDMFVTPPVSLDKTLTATRPLFDSLQFAIEAYNDATTNTTTVTHIFKTGGSLKTKNACQSS